MNDLTPVIQAMVVTIAGLILSSIVVSILTVGVQFLRQKLAVIKGNITSEQLAILQEIADFVVKAVEQSGVAAKLKDDLYDKKYEAIKLLQSMLDARGYAWFSVAEVEAAVEEAVRRNFTKPPSFYTNTTGPMKYGTWSETKSAYQSATGE